MPTTLPPFRRGSPRVDVGALAYQQHLAELDGGAGFAFELLDAQHVVFGDTILLTARGDDCVHK